MNRPGTFVPMSNRPDHELRRIVDALNGEFPPEQFLGPADEFRRQRRVMETPFHLRKLVRAWLSSGPDLNKFSLKNRDMMSDVFRQFQTGMQLNPIVIVRAAGGGAALARNHIPQPEPYDEALRLFLDLLLNPECTKLASPCDRCGKYYVRRSAKNKRYCSRSCGTRATAIAATKESRGKAHAVKLQHATRAAQEWATARTKLDWKQWVHRKVPTITPKFLTRAVNKGELKVPVRQ